jgi:threonine/homoserine/homoserine lactone efflux protein
MTDPILFILAVLTLLGTPGPTNTLLATSGATAGVRRSLVLLVGELGGYLIAIAAIRIVLGPVIHAWPVVGIALKVAVVAYLVVIAVRLWRHGNSLTDEKARIDVPAVFVTTLLNPKALIFALSIIPAEHPALWAYFTAFAVAVPLVGLCWILLGRAVGAAAGERHVGIVRKIASVALVGFAGVIAVSVLG